MARTNRSQKSARRSAPCPCPLSQLPKLISSSFKSSRLSIPKRRTASATRKRSTGWRCEKRHSERTRCNGAGNGSRRSHAQRGVLSAQETGCRDPRAQALTVLGHALAGLGRQADAAGAYRRALALRRDLGQSHLLPEPLAGLARVAEACGDRAGALAHVEEILCCLETYPELYGTWEPLRVYLTCYRVLRAGEDPRAEEILDAAYRLLQERAARIEDERLRRSYLENVAAHREIIAAWEESSHA